MKIDPKELNKATKRLVKLSKRYMKAKEKKEKQMMVEKQKWIKKLKPYWKEYEEIANVFSKKTRELEEKMNKELKTEIELEFFYCDGSCVGIGAGFEEDRDEFPLIEYHDFEE